ncbi:MAG: sporulation protein YabP [Firmicutes bacterium]|nr:sporulation protein YabP [Bacillota bacterium]
MEEKRHTLYIDDRQSLVVTDVTDVGSFSEEEVLISLSEGGLVIKGESLHMQQLDLEEGRAVISGRVHSAVYTQKHKKEVSLWARIWK